MLLPYRGPTTPSQEMVWAPSLSLAATPVSYTHLDKLGISDDPNIQETRITSMYMTKLQSDVHSFSKYVRDVYKRQAYR